MKVLVCYNTGKQDGCSWYRGFTPWAHLQRMDAGNSVYMSTVMPTWMDMQAIDVVYLLRPMEPKALHVLELAEDYGVKVWVDYDDNLFHLPKDNPIHHVFQQFLPPMQKFIESADVLTVSTPVLREHMLHLNKNVEIVPNSFNPLLLKFRQGEPARKLVLWRGSNTHDRDVFSVADELVDVAKMHPDHQYFFMGANPCPYAVTDKINNCQILEQHMDPIRFFQSMCLLRPKVVIVPLHDSPFNRAKSNIAAIEASLAGAATLAPDWETWDLPGVVHYRDPANFRTQLHKLIVGDIDAAECAKKTWDHVSKNMTLQGANEKRIEILRGLCVASSR